MSAEVKPAEQQADLPLEIAHLLLIDIVGYSKVLVNEQIELLQQLNRIVRTTDSFRAAEKKGNLLRIPTGDGMALLFFHSPEEPTRCALEISRQLKENPGIQVRMGVHSGPITKVTDVNDRVNVAGAGINLAHRIMECGDAGHILLSKHIADDLSQYRHWQSDLHDLGECEVKHGVRLHVVNLHKGGLGNPAVPQKLRPGRRGREAARVSVRPVAASRWPQFGLGAAVVLSAMALIVSFLIFYHPKWFAAGRPPVAAGGTPVVSDKSIAVLPFQNSSDDPQNLYLSAGVQDEVLTDLAKVADLKVISRTSVMQYAAGGQRNLREIAKQLGVAHILEGTVQRAGNRVRVSAQLIDARTDTHLWAERYDRDVLDIFALESEVAEQIVAKLKAKLSPAEKNAIERTPTDNLDAYDLYTRARALDSGVIFGSRLSEHLPEAVQLLEGALARDPNFFSAHCLVASIHDQIYFFGVDRTPARLAKAEASIKQTFALRPEAGEAHVASARHAYWGYRDYDRALQELAIAAQTLPNEPAVFELSGYVMRRKGEWQESIQQFQRALELDPFNLAILQTMCFSYEHLRQFIDAATILDRALKVAPNDLDTQVRRAAIDLQWHADPKPLHSLIGRILQENPNAGETLADYRFFLALCERDRVAAREALNALSSDGTNDDGFLYPRAFFEGVFARFCGDEATAQSAFTRARVDVNQILQQEPVHAEALSVLGLIDAALHQKEPAIRECRHALELLPPKKDAVNGGTILRNLALVYAWTGEKELALNTLQATAELPGTLNYGYLQLHPDWDGLRGESRFEKIVADLAPKKAEK